MTDEQNVLIEIDCKEQSKWAPLWAAMEGAFKRHFISLLIDWLIDFEVGV